MAANTASLSWKGFAGNASISGVSLSPWPPPSSALALLGLCHLHSARRNLLSDIVRVEDVYGRAELANAN